MVKRYTTASGSIYTIDFDEQKWYRQRGENANELRTDSGTYFDYEITDAGIILFCPPLQSVKGMIRIIESTRIVKVETLDGLELPIVGQSSDESN